MPPLPSADGADRGRRGKSDVGETLAALDLGTNNCRLLVARRVSAREPSLGFQVIDAFSRIVRLGEGLAASGMLCEEAMARTIEALKICAEKIAGNRVSRARMIATEACRRAANCADFTARVRAETGIELEIISSEEEARLVVAGCAPLLDPRVPFALVFDIGGGSTELVWLQLGADAAAPQILDFALAAPRRRHPERPLWRPRSSRSGLCRDGR